MPRCQERSEFNAKSISNVAARVSTAQDISPPPYAAKIGADEQAALQQGMADKAAEFKQTGAELYRPS